MRLFYRMIRAIARLTLRVLYRLEVNGEENIPKGPSILAANHSSYLDPPIVACGSPFELHFLARSTLFSHFLFGHLIRALNAHPVDTDEADTQALRLVLRLLKEGDKVLIFPEGGRSLDGKLVPFKEGVAMLALHSQVPVVPVRIVGAFEVWESGRKLPRWRGKIRVTFGRPIHPSRVEGIAKKEAKQVFTRLIREEMESLPFTKIR